MTRAKFGKGSGQGPATIRDVARYAGISTATVSRVLNGVTTVRPAMVERVRAACEALKFQPNPAARSLAGGRSVIVGLLIADISIPFFLGIVRGAEATLRRGGYLPILCSFQEDPIGVREFQQYMELMVSVSLAGAIVVPRAERDPTLKLFREHGIPVVNVDSRSPDKAADTVLIDNVGAAREAVEHLVVNGYRRIGLISGPDNSTTGHDRTFGYRAGLRAAGLANDPALERHGPYSEHTGYRYANELLDLDLPVDALFACNHTLTIGVLQALHERGVRIGQDLGLVGFDDVSSLPGEATLTTVVQPAYEIGVTAAQRLMHRLETPGPHIRQEIALPYRLCVGTSTSPRAGADSAVSAFAGDAGRGSLLGERRCEEVGTV